MGRCGVGGCFVEDREGEKVLCGGQGEMEATQ